MASTPDYVEYIAERLASTGSVRYKKMFGEYMVYVNDKPLVLVCDNTAFMSGAKKKKWTPILSGC